MSIDVKGTPMSHPEEQTAEPEPERRRGLYQLLAIAGLAATVVLLIVVPSGDSSADESDSTIVQVGSFLGQGGSEPWYARDAAQLARAGDGIEAVVAVPTPPPGSYEYPSSDEHPPWAAPHPDVVPGGGDTPEAFTLWMFVFNNPDLCTDGLCDLDDIGTDTAALGGGFQVDGRVGDGRELVLRGRVRLGQDSATGATLENAVGAEVHLAIAPHGMALSDAELWRQLNGPIGNPTYWWAVTFLPPDGQ